MAQLGSNTSGHLFDTSFTTEGILFSASSGVITSTAAGSAGQVMQSAGNASPPAYSTATYPSTAGTSGNVLTSNGTNWASSAPSAVAKGFFAYASSNLTNVTGNNVVYTVLFDSTVRNDGSAYNASTGLFTAPFTGLYSFTAQIFTQGITTGNDNAIAYVGNVMSQRLVEHGVGAVSTAFTSWANTVSFIIPMTATNTVGIQVTSNQATQTVSILGSAINPNAFTVMSSFSGCYLGT